MGSNIIIMPPSRQMGIISGNKQPTAPIKDPDFIVRVDFIYQPLDKKKNMNGVSLKVGSCWESDGQSLWVQPVVPTAAFSSPEDLTLLGYKIHLDFLHPNFTKCVDVELHSKLDTEARTFKHGDVIQMQWTSKGLFTLA